MPDAEKTLDILIRTRADRAGTGQTLDDLNRVKAAQTEVNSGVLDSGRSLVQIQRDQDALLSSALGKRVATIESLDQEKAIQTQLQVIAATRFDMMQAMIEGNAAQATILREELAIRQASLGVMRAGALTQAELVKLTETEAALIATTGKESLLAGANLNKAKGEAMVLARELSTGSFNARTLGAFLGAMGPYLTVAAIAGFGLYQVIAGIRDEQEKFNKDLEGIDDKLAKEVDKWREIANLAKDARDIGRLSASISPAIDDLETKVLNFQQNQPAWWKKTIDFVRQGFDEMWGDVADKSADSFRRAWERELAELKNRLVDTLTVARDAILKAEGTVAETAQLRQSPPATTTAYYETQIRDLKAEQVALETELRDVNLQTNEGQSRAEQIITRIGEIDREIVRDEEEKDRAARRFLETTKEAQLLLQVIRDKEKIISDNPFLNVDQKQLALHQQFIDEERQLAAAIGETKRQMDAAQGAGAQQQVDQLREKLHALTTEYVELQFKIQTTTFGGQLQAELTQWVNSFGTSAHQVASIITGTLNTAISGTSQALTGLIFGTKNWQQAFAQAAQSIVGQIIQIGIQFVISRLFMSAINRAAGVADTAAAAAAAAPVAAAWSVAATSASIATYGAADVTGVAAYIAALASGKTAAIASAGFESGGPTGGRRGQPAGIVHGEEYVFSAEETDALGVGFLSKLAAAAGGRARFPGYQDGGWVEPPSTYVPGGGPAGGTWVWVRTADGLLAPMYVPSGTGYANVGGFPGMFGGDRGGRGGDPSGAGLVPGSLGGTSLAVIDFWNATAQFGQFGIDWAYDANGDPQPMSYFAQSGETPSADPISGIGVGSGGVSVSSSDSAPPTVTLPPWLAGIARQLGIGMTGTGSVAGGLTSAQIGAIHAYNAAVSFALGTVAPGPPRWAPGRLVVEGPDFSDAAIGVVRGKFGAARMPTIWRGHSSGSVFSGGPGISQKQLTLGFTPFGPTGASVPGGLSSAAIVAALLATSTPAQLASIYGVPMPSAGSSGGPAILADWRAHDGGFLDPAELAGINEPIVIAKSGEFVMNPAAVSMYGVDFMRAINSQSISIPTLGKTPAPITGPTGIMTPAGADTIHAIVDRVLSKIELHGHVGGVDEAMRRYNESPAARKRFIRSVKTHR